MERRVGPARRMLVGASCLLASFGALRSVSAQPPAPAPAPPSAPAVEVDAAPKIVRIALSRMAAEKLSELRVRRLVELQLDDDVEVPSESAGPLDEHAVRVFIDLPEPTLVSVQVQAPDGRLERRIVDVAGLAWEVATRYVALAASQSARAQLAPRRKPRPRPPTPDEVARTLSAKPSISLAAGIEAVYASDLEAGLVGSRLQLGFHQRPLSEVVSFAALGSTSGGLWLEGDVSAYHRFWFGPDLRLAVGAGFALAVTEDLRDDGESGVELWVRPHALTSLDVRVTERAWLTFGIDPGMTVDPKRESFGVWAGGLVRLGYEGN